MTNQQTGDIPASEQVKPTHVGTLAMLLLSVALFLPLLNTGYTTHDDTRTAIEAWKTEGLLELPLAKARSVGRINHVVKTPIEWLPYLFQHKGVYQLLRLGGALLPFIVFVWVLGRCSESSALGFAAGCVALGLYQNNWQHNLLTAYPFCYQITFCLVLLAAWLQYTACKYSRPSRAVIGAICLFFTFLIYEAFLAYLPLFFFLTVVWRPFDATGSLRKKIKDWLPYLIPMIAAAGLFLMFYIGFRLLYPSQYEGVTLSISSPFAFLRTLIQFVIGTLPTIFFFVDRYTVDRVFMGWEPFSPNIGIVLAHLESAWVLKAGVFTAAMLYLLPVVARSQKITGIGVTAVTSLLMIVLPFVLISLTPKYQGWAAQGELAYVPTYFAFFGTALLIVAAAAAVYRRASNQFWPNLLFGSLFFTAALLTSAANDHTARDQEQAQLKWRIVDALFATRAFEELPDNSLLITPGLWEKIGILDLRHDQNYWSDYFSVKSRKIITVVESASHATRLQLNAGGYYYLDLLKDHRQSLAAVVFAKLTERSTLASDSISLFTAGPHRKFQIIGRFASVPDHSRATVWVNNGPIPRAVVGTRYFSMWVDRFKGLQQPTAKALSERSFFELVKIALERIFAHPTHRSTPYYPFVFTQIRSDRPIDLRAVNVSYQQPGTAQP